MIYLDQIVNRTKIGEEYSFDILLLDDADPNYATRITKVYHRPITEEDIKEISAQTVINENNAKGYTVDGVAVTNQIKNSDLVNPDEQISIEDIKYKEIQ